MEIILLKEVKRLGEAGDVKKVADGYARNYLIPRGLAVPATVAARKQVAERAAAETGREASARAAAEAEAEGLDGIELVFKVRAGDAGRLYGSVTSADIAEKLGERIGQKIDKRKVMLPEPLKEVGRSKVEVKWHSDVKTAITILIQAEET